MSYNICIWILYTLILVKKRVITYHHGFIVSPTAPQETVCFSYPSRYVTSWFQHSAALCVNFKSSSTSRCHSLLELAISAQAWPNGTPSQKKKLLKCSNVQQPCFGPLRTDKLLKASEPSGKKANWQSALGAYRCWHSSIQRPNHSESRAETLPPALETSSANRRLQRTTMSLKKVAAYSLLSNGFKCVALYFPRFLLLFFQEMHQDVPLVTYGCWKNTAEQRGIEPFENLIILWSKCFDEMRGREAPAWIQQALFSWF